MQKSFLLLCFFFLLLLPIVSWVFINNRCTLNCFSSLLLCMNDWLCVYVGVCIASRLTLSECVCVSVFIGGVIILDLFGFFSYWIFFFDFFFAKQLQLLSIQNFFSVCVFVLSSGFALHCHNNDDNHHHWVQTKSHVNLNLKVLYKERRRIKQLWFIFKLWNSELKGNK